MIATLVGTSMDNLKLLPTCNDSLIMVFPLIDAGGAAKRVDWRFWPTSRSLASLRSWGRSLRSTVAVATRIRGLPFRGLAAAGGSQFLTAVPNEGTSHAAAGRVLVFEPGASRAIHRRFVRHGVCFARPNVRAEAGPTAKRQARVVENAPAHCAGLAF